MTSTTDAAATLAEATASRDDLVSRIATAQTTLQDATAYQTGLARQTFRGDDIAPRTVREAGKKIVEAEETLTFLKLQLPLADAAVAAATVTHAEAVQAEKDATFAIAVRDLIASADELQAAGAALTSAGERYFARYEAVILAKSATGNTPSEADRAGYISARSRIKSVIPADIQYAIIQQGSAVYADVSAIERSQWGRFAAPAPKADESFNRRDAEAREKIEKEQAFAAQGRADNARNSAWVDSWHPTQMHGNDAWHASRAAAMKVSEV
jgi:hypothetical protein